MEASRRLDQIYLGSDYSARPPEDPYCSVFGTPDRQWIEQLRGALETALEQSGVPLTTEAEREDGAEREVSAEEPPERETRQVSTPAPTREKRPARLPIGERQRAVAEVLLGTSHDEVARRRGCNPDELAEWVREDEGEGTGVEVTDTPHARRIVKRWYTRLSLMNYLAPAIIAAVFYVVLKDSGGDPRPAYLLSGGSLVLVFLLGTNRTVYRCLKRQIRIGYSPVGFTFLYRSVPDEIRFFQLKQHVHRSRKGTIFITYQVHAIRPDGSSRYLAGRIRPPIHAYMVATAIAEYYQAPLKVHDDEN